MKFDDPLLVARYGSWMRVQVAFYDFVFHWATEMCASHWKQMALEEINNQFCDGGDLYERTVKAIEHEFNSFEEAWKAFLQLQPKLNSL